MRMCEWTIAGSSYQDDMSAAEAARNERARGVPRVKWDGVGAREVVEEARKAFR